MRPDAADPARAIGLVERALGFDRLAIAPRLGAAARDRRAVSPPPAVKWKNRNEVPEMQGWFIYMPSPADRGRLRGYRRYR
jgi:hypothetical protein